jgi:endonuclease VIII
VLEFVARARTPALGTDILDEPPDLDAMVANLRATAQSRELGEALLDQRLVAGIGNMWKAEALWAARVSPWVRLGEVADDELFAVLGHAARLMRGRLEGVPPAHRVYRRRVCPRCGGRIATRGQGDDNRTTWWCPACQGGKERAGA